MLNKIFSVSLFFAFALASVATEVNAQDLSGRNFGERFVISSLTHVSGAEFTFSAADGNGSFGSLSQLRQAGFIDPALASGVKYGYVFVVSNVPPTQGSPASFRLTATPASYPKTGRRSFYIDTNGEVHGANKNGAVATAADPYIDSCSLFGTADNERCTMADLRTLHGAQLTYAATIGVNSYGSLAQLSESFVIGQRLADGNEHQYSFTVVTTAPSAQVPGSFKIYATPLNYGVSGIRSFFVDTSGVIRGADKNGLPADENDPPI